MYKNRKRYDKNGYVVVEYPEHPKAFDTGTGFNGVYEHVLMAEEEVVNRLLRPGEVVHHLDLNRSNNSPDNLLVLDGSQHNKLHSWLDKNEIIPTKIYQERQALGCIRCGICEKPVRNGYKYCSADCHAVANEDKKRYTHPSKEELEKLVWSKPTTQVAKDFGVSDKAIEKLCKKLDVEKPPRGYWAKIEEGYLITKLDF